ncbi:hypothetical protein B7486_67815, partial [cyanobacterium TDX16]
MGASSGRISVSGPGQVVRPAGSSASASPQAVNRPIARRSSVAAAVSRRWLRDGAGTCPRPPWCAELLARTVPIVSWPRQRDGARSRPARRGKAMITTPPGIPVSAAPERGTIRREVRIARSAAEVWSVVGDPSTIHRWFPGMADSTVDGTTRLITTGSGIPLPEEILTVD